MASGTDVAQAAASEQTAANADDSKPPDGQPKAIRPKPTSRGTKPIRDSRSAAPEALAIRRQSKASKRKHQPKPKQHERAQKKAEAIKAADARIKAAQEARKRAGAKRAALNLNKQKTAPTTPPAVSAGQGQ